MTVTTRQVTTRQVTTRQRALALVSAFSIFLLVVVGYSFLKPRADYPDRNPGAEINFHVANGESGWQIAIDLHKQGVILKAETFQRLVARDKRAIGIAPGIHRIQTKIPSKVALEQLLSQQRIVNLIIVRDGARFQEVAELLNSDKNLTGTIKAPKGLRTLEGVLYPGQYSFAKGTSRQVVIQSMLDAYQRVAKELQLSKGFGIFSAEQVLTVASMIQVEGDPQDFSHIAQVIYNRLRIGMPLQLNSTIEYALKVRKLHISIKELSVDSPYNTYKNVGLPPGPIGSPTKSALYAALHPTQGDWLYFITVKPGDTRFTKSFEVFQQWNEEFNINYRKGLFS